MTTLLRAFAGLACLAALATPAYAQGDFLTAPKVACTPDSVTRCSGGQCTTKPATAKDKGEVLVIDFAAKKVSVRAGGKVNPFAEIAEDQVSGEERQFALAPGEGKNGERLRAKLSKAGKLSLAIGADGSRAEATCAVES